MTVADSQLRGKVIRVGRDVDTDAIIAGQWGTTVDPAILGQHLLENYDPDLVKRIQRGDLLFAEDNFGSGSSREHAPLAIKGAGISCVVASSFARIFYRNALNLALPILVCPEAVAAARDGQVAEVNVRSGEILLDGQRFQAEPLPPFMQDLIAQGGLVNWVRARLKEKAAAAAS